MDSIIEVSRGSVSLRTAGAVNEPKAPTTSADRWNDKPEFKRVFLQMMAEARAWREAGGVSARRPIREFSGREDYDRKRTGEDWA